MFRLTQTTAAAAELLSFGPPNQIAQERLHSIFQECQDIESDYVRWMEGADPRFEFQTWNLGDDQAVKVTAVEADSARQTRRKAVESSGELDSSRRILTYTSLWFSNVWNGLRGARLALHELILCIARHLEIDTWTTGNVQTSTSLVQDSIDDICDSVAYVMGDVYVDAGGHLQLTAITGAPERQGSAASAYFLLWPLYRVTICPIATRSQKGRATDALAQIGHRLGMRLAFALAQMKFRTDEAM